MTSLKSTFVVLGIVAAATVSGSVFANHRDTRSWPPRQAERSYVVVPPARSDVTVGFVAGAPAYYYEPAPRYYYYEPAPRYYYYEPAPAYYYYYDSSPFPETNTRD